MSKKLSLFDDIVKSAKKQNMFAFQLDEDNPYEVKEWIDTGCYLLNAVLSDGDIYKGMPTGKRIVISGLEATVKSLLVMLLVKKYITKKKNVKIIFFESEGSTTVDIAKKMGITNDQMIIIPVVTVEETRTQMVNILDKIIQDKFGLEVKINEDTGKKTTKRISNFEPKSEEEQENFVFVLDSLGMLSSIKETEDVASGSDKKDMTRAQVIKAFARIISLKLSLTGCPFLVVNHLYTNVGNKYVPYSSSGGTGVKYFADIHLFNTKSKQKVGTEQIGIVLKLHVDKSRYMQENKSVKLLISFKKGLYKYSGLLELAQTLGIFKKDGISYVLPDGSKEKMKTVRENVSKYMTHQTLDLLRESILKDFGFGSKGFIIDDDTEDNKENIEIIDSDVKETEESEDITFEE